MYCQKTQPQTGAPALSHGPSDIIWFFINGLEFSSSLEKSGCIPTECSFRAMSFPEGYPSRIPGLSQKCGRDLHETQTVEVCKSVFDSVSLHKCINVVINVVNQAACDSGT